MLRRAVLGGLFALAAGGAIAQAGAPMNAERLAGTWECYGPGQAHPHKPPIVWFSDVSARDGLATMQVDAFKRAVVGEASVTAESDGSLKIKAGEGEALYVKGLHDSGRKVTMNLRRDGVGSYRCARLPKYDTPMIPRQKTINETETKT